MFSQLIALRRIAVGLQALGFLLVMAVIWLDESLDLPHLLFHAAPTPFRPEEAGFETACLALVGLASLVLTSALLRRLSYAQSFIAFCPSCQRVRRGDDWTSLSDLLQGEQAHVLSYNLCPGCTARFAPTPGEGIPVET
jgi:hypothetical protein